MAEQKEVRPRKGRWCEACGAGAFRHPYLLERHIRTELEKELPKKKLGSIGSHTSTYGDQYLEVHPKTPEEAASEYEDERERPAGDQ